MLKRPSVTVTLHASACVLLPPWATAGRHEDSLGASAHVSIHVSFPDDQRAGTRFTAGRVSPWKELSAQPGLDRHEVRPGVSPCTPGELTQFPRPPSDEVMSASGVAERAK